MVTKCKLLSKKCVRFLKKVGKDLLIIKQSLDYKFGYMKKNADLAQCFLHKNIHTLQKNARFN